MEYNVHTLSNGIRLLHVPAASSISHVCIIINSGSRDEADQEAGTAHFIEHMLFKRTAKRSTNQIINRLESVGADVNAYTTKEYTCIHASSLNPYLDRTLELFADIVFQSTFPDNEITKEKSIILDEISSYHDQPEEAIYDDFEDIIFSGHALGHNILGLPETVNQVNREKIQGFINKNYRTDEIVVAIHGNYAFKKIIRSGSRYFGQVPANLNNKNRKPPAQVNSVQNVEEKPIAQAHCVMGRQAYSLHSPFKTGLMLLNNMLGGTGMSSILNLEIREKHGIAYTIESNYSPLSDTGLFTIYFGTDAEKLNRTNKLIEKELKKLRDNRLSDVQLHSAQKKFIGQIALGEENRLGLLISMAKSLIDYNKIDSLETVFKKIEEVSSSQLLHIANEMLGADTLTSLTFTPSE